MTTCHIGFNNHHDHILKKSSNDPMIFRLIRGKPIFDGLKFMVSYIFWVKPPWKSDMWLWTSTLWIKTNLLNINIAIIQISFAIFHGNPQWLWLTPPGCLGEPPGCRRPAPRSPVAPSALWRSTGPRSSVLWREARRRALQTWGWAGKRGGSRKNWRFHVDVMVICFWV